MSGRGVKEKEINISASILHLNIMYLRAAGGGLRRAVDSRGGWGRCGGTVEK